MNVIEANRLVETSTKRNETRISRSWWKWNKSRNRKFCWWFWMIVCWFDDLIWNCSVWFLFLFLTNDVSTFKQKDDDCKDHFDVNKQIDSRNHENRLLTECRLISTNKKIDYWFVDEIFIFHHDKLIDFRNKKINCWLSFSQIHDHFRWFTMRIMKYIHRFQRKNFTFWRFSFDSRIFTNDSTIFF